MRKEQGVSLAGVEGIHHGVTKSSHCRLGPRLRGSQHPIRGNRGHFRRIPSKYFAKGDSSKMMLSIVIVASD